MKVPSAYEAASSLPIWTESHSNNATKPHQFLLCPTPSLVPIRRIHHRSIVSANVHTAAGHYPVRVQGVTGISYINAFRLDGPALFNVADEDIPSREVLSSLPHFRKGANSCRRNILHSTFKRRVFAPERPHLLPHLSPRSFISGYQ